jgi:glutamate/tyrosine decarboxylase-like PLP-dependent enzyme
MTGDEFRQLGHAMVDRVASLLDSLRERRVTPGESPDEVRAALGHATLPQAGAPAGQILEEAAELLFEHSLFNGHPRFWGFITSSAAPIGALADLLAAAVNANVGGWTLSPMATEIEAQTVSWIAELLGFPTSCGGLLVSGGNAANLVGFWTGRCTKAPWDLRGEGLVRHGRQLRVYASAETHTWIHKAADLSGMGTDAIRWIPTDVALRMNVDALQSAIAADRRAGDLPVIVVGAAGSVSTGAIDPLRAIAEVCREHDLWFHVDGAYGAPAAALPEADEDLKALSLADSVAVDPHKWLYAPLEAGCALVRDPERLRATFSYHPPYYPEKEGGPAPPIYYHELGPQNSRGFRALKVWAALRQAGRTGYERMIRDDIALARRLDDRAAATPQLQQITQGLSITTFRYVPADVVSAVGARGPIAESSAVVEAYLTTLNKAIVARLEKSGQAYITHAIIDGRYVLRACVVNFRTTEADIDALPELVTAIGDAADAELRPQSLRHSLA